jgi:hypothetical protein
VAEATDFSKCYEATVTLDFEQIYIIVRRNHGRGIHQDLEHVPSLSGAILTADSAF